MCTNEAVSPAMSAETRLTRMRNMLERMILIQSEQITNSYMQGLGNGLVLARSLITDEEPVYFDRPEIIIAKMESVEEE